MSERIRHKGPPPHIGWWLVADGWWSWYDGSQWSMDVYENAKPDTVASWAEIKVDEMRRWSDYWPPNARVPRIDPRAAQIGKTNQPGEAHD